MIILPEDKAIVSLLSADEAQQVLLAIFSEPGEVSQLTPMANMAYTAIRSKSDRISEKKSRAGRSGGAQKNNQNAKKQAEQADSAKTSYRTTTVSDTVSDTVTVDTTPHKPPTGGGEFELFWTAYPKKKSKGDAEKAWKSIKPSKELVATMLDKLAQAKTCPDWTKESGQFIPYPATWLRAKGWEDEYQSTSEYGGECGGDKDGDSL